MVPSRQPARFQRRQSLRSQLFPKPLLSRLLPGLRRKTDGVDLVPYIKGEDKSEPHEWLCWQNRSWLSERAGAPVTPTARVHSCAIRKGNWKLVRLGERVGSGTPPPAWQLCNLGTDIGERDDVADQNEDVINELSARFEAWRSSMHPTVE